MTIVSNQMHIEEKIDIKEKKEEGLSGVLWERPLSNSGLPQADDDDHDVCQFAISNEYLGELSIMYIFARYQFNWDEVKYSIYTTYSLITHSIGTLFSISVFSRKLKADDAVLGMISTSSKICGALVLAFARNGYEVYLSPLLEILNGTSAIALRSIASKLVSYQELGKVYSLFGVAETMMPIIFAPLYSRVYVATLKILPGAVFLVSILVTIPALGIFSWFYCQHKKDEKEKRLNVPCTPPLPAEPPIVPA